MRLSTYIHVVLTLRMSGVASIPSVYLCGMYIGHFSFYHMSIIEECFIALLYYHIHMCVSSHDHHCQQQ